MRYICHSLYPLQHHYYYDKMINEYCLNFEMKENNKIKL